MFWTRHRQRADETPMAHIAMAVYPGVPLGDIHMALVTSYFDASGDNASGHALTVGGFVSDVKKWGRFTTEWREELDSQGITDFHMTDFMACAQGFDKFRGRQELQAEILTNLIKIIKKNVRKSFATTILLDDWKAVNAEYRLKECHATPYAMASLSVLNRSLMWIGRPHKPVRKRSHHDFTEFVFEEGDNGQDDFRWIMNETKRRGKGKLDSIYPIFRPKTLLPLQCCDFAAWEKRSAVKNLINDIPVAFRDSLEGLMKVPHEWGVIDQAVLAEYARWLGVPKRDEPFDRKTWKPAFSD